YLAFCLFYPGGALKMRGLMGRAIPGDVDRAELLPVILRLLQNDDGRARGAVGTVFKLMELEDLKPILPELVEAVRTPSPSGVMFSNGVRLAGLDFLAEHRIAEGMELCIAVTEIDKWGKKDRIDRCLSALETYGAAAREVLPQLEDLAARLAAHKEARSLKKQLDRCEAVIAAVRASDDDRPVRTVKEVMGRKRRRR
ncbi:MAG: acetylesterase, partial [Planctomycetota bacterium]